MRHRKLLGLLCLSGLLLIGCSKQETSLQNESETLSTAQTQENLVLGDLSNLDCTLIESEIPLPEHLYKINSQGEDGWNDEKIYKEFPKLIAAYGGPNEEELNIGKDILIETWESGNAAFIPLEEWEGEEIWDIIYCSNTLFLNMNDIRQIFTFQPNVMEQITGETWERPYVWQINDNADPISTYEIGKDEISDISYRLDGQEVSLEEGIAFAEKMMTENKDLPLISTPGFEYRVQSVQVYQFGENYAYHFTMNLYYQGIKLAPESGGIPENNDSENLYYYVFTFDKCTMFQKDKLSGIYMFDFLNEKQDSIITAEPTVNYEKALQILSGYLSESHVFQLLNAELVYSFYTETKKDDTVSTNHITPTWQFEISAEGMQQFTRLFILIDVETGEVVELYA